MNKFTWLIDFNIFLRSHKTAVPLGQFQQDMTQWQNIIGKENSEGSLLFPRVITGEMLKYIKDSSPEPVGQCQLNLSQRSTS